MISFRPNSWCFFIAMLVCPIASQAGIFEGVHTCEIVSRVARDQSNPSTNYTGQETGSFVVHIEGDNIRVSGSWRQGEQVLNVLGESNSSIVGVALSEAGGGGSIYGLNSLVLGAYPTNHLGATYTFATADGLVSLFSTCGKMPSR